MIDTLETYFLQKLNKLDRLVCDTRNDRESVKEEIRKLKGFIWRELEQPKTKEDIFIKDGDEKRTPIKKKSLKKQPMILNDKEKLNKKSGLSIQNQ